MPASSLIFVVIIAVWAAFLLQHWIRRRDHLATAKSVDRFSEAMRVLERRQSLTRMDLSRPAPRSYAVAPPRPARPDVVVKRAEGAQSSRSAVTMGKQRPAQPRSGRLLRAVTLLLAVAVTAAAVALGTGPLLPWWVAAASPALLLVTVTVLRATARPAATRPARVPPRSLASGTVTRAASGPARQAVPQREVRPVGPRMRRVVREAEAAPLTRGRPARPAAGAEPVLYDLEQVEQASTQAPSPGEAREPAPVAEQEPARPVEPSAPGTWQPVAVPTPTYLLKAAARQPGHRAPQRTPLEELPFDGHALALEEEFEELPAVHG